MKNTCLSQEDFIRASNSRLHSKKSRSFECKRSQDSQEIIRGIFSRVYSNVRRRSQRFKGLSILLLLKNRWEAQSIDHLQYLTTRNYFKKLLLTIELLIEIQAARRLFFVILKYRGVHYLISFNQLVIAFISVNSLQKYKRSVYLSQYKTAISEFLRLLDSDLNTSTKGHSTIFQYCTSKGLIKRYKKTVLRIKVICRQYFVSQACQLYQSFLFQLRIKKRGDFLFSSLQPRHHVRKYISSKLCNFGCAVYSPLLRSTICGTPLYTHPEMIRMEEYDSKVDIWCIGMLTYELLYGTMPFNIQSLNDLPKIVNDEILFPPRVNITREAESFIRSCMKKTLQEKFSIKLFITIFF